MPVLALEAACSAGPWLPRGKAAGTTQPTADGAAAVRGTEQAPGTAAARGAGCTAPSGSQHARWGPKPAGGAVLPPAFGAAACLQVSTGPALTSRKHELTAGLATQHSI